MKKLLRKLFLYLFKEDFKMYTIQPRPEIPHIEWCEPVRFGKGGSKSGRGEKQIRKDRKKNKARKTHRRKK